MVQSGYFEFVAKVVRIVVVAAQEKCIIFKEDDPSDKCLRYNSQIKVHGYSTGAHIGAYFCRSMKEHWMKLSKDKTETHNMVSVLAGNLK